MSGTEEKETTKKKSKHQDILQGTFFDTLQGGRKDNTANSQEKCM